MFGKADLCWQPRSGVFEQSQCRLEVIRKIRGFVYVPCRIFCNRDSMCSMLRLPQHPVTLVNVAR
eukprot:8608171-Pyramimonas_sp.AAC.1